MKKKLKKINKHLNKICDILDIPRNENIYALDLSQRYLVGVNRVISINLSGSMEFNGRDLPCYYDASKSVSLTESKLEKTIIRKDGTIEISGIEEV